LLVQYTTNSAAVNLPPLSVHSIRCLWSHSFSTVA
jgi:hypothetical protein